MSRWLLALLLCLASGSPAAAEDLLMVRSRQAFPEAMLTLQQSIADRGYTVARVQRVDVGLTAMGYATDKYRVVFLAKPEELRALSARHPELVPYLPLKVSIFAEGQQTLLVTANPGVFGEIYPDPELAGYFARWEQDLRAILEAVRRAE